MKRRKEERKGKFEMWGKRKREAAIKDKKTQRGKALKEKGGGECVSRAGRANPVGELLYKREGEKGTQPAEANAPSPQQQERE
ncbi:hypothetical protein PAMP_021454 [Pampus punctatissimus]